MDPDVVMNRISRRGCLKHGHVTSFSAFDALNHAAPRLLWLASKGDALFWRAPW